MEKKTEPEMSDEELESEWNVITSTIGGGRCRSRSPEGESRKQIEPGTGTTNERSAVNSNRKGSVLKIRATNHKKLMAKMINRRMRATRTQFKLISDKTVHLLMTVRFNFPCNTSLKKLKGNRLLKKF